MPQGARELQSSPPGALFSIHCDTTARRWGLCELGVRDWSPLRASISQPGQVGKRSSSPFPDVRCRRLTHFTISAGNYLMICISSQGGPLVLFPSEHVFFKTFLTAVDAVLLVLLLFVLVYNCLFWKQNKFPSQ